MVAQLGWPNKYDNKVNARTPRQETLPRAITNSVAEHELPTWPGSFETKFIYILYSPIYMAVVTTTIVITLSNNVV